MIGEMGKTRTGPVWEPEAARSCLVAVAATLALLAGCASRPDPARDLVEDIRGRLVTLDMLPEGTLTFRREIPGGPGGCPAGFTVNAYAGGAIVIRCDGGPSWSTTDHARTFRVPKDLAVSHRAGEPLMVTIRREGLEFALVALQ